MAFVVLMLVVGRRVIPWVLHAVAHGGSRELLRLAVISIALGVAFGSAELFGVSFALGAFFAGMILAEEEHLRRYGAGFVMAGEREIARELAEAVLAPRDAAIPA